MRQKEGAEEEARIFTSALPPAVFTPAGVRFTVLIAGHSPATTPRRAGKIFTPLFRAAPPPPRHYGHAFAFSRHASPPPRRRHAVAVVTGVSKKIAPARARCALLARARCARWSGARLCGARCALSAARDGAR